MRIKTKKRLSIFALLCFLGIFAFRCGFANNILKFSPIPLTCYDENDGKLKIEKDDNSVKIKLKIYDDSAFHDLLYDITIEKSETIIENLKAQTYYLKYTYNNKEWIDTLSIYKPEKLEPGVIQIEKGLENINNSDAILVAAPKGGTKPYSYKWSSNAGGVNTQKLKNVGIGTYFCEINDVNNCGPVRSTIFFNQFIFPDHIKSE